MVQRLLESGISFMKTIERHKIYFNTVVDRLSVQKTPHGIRYLIRELMDYLEENHLTDKNYLDKNRLFVRCEAEPDLIEKQNTETMLSFLTMIYRIDYIAPDSDAYMIYYNNGLLLRILKHLILGLDV